MTAADAGSVARASLATGAGDDDHRCSGDAMRRLAAVGVMQCRGDGTALPMDSGTPLTGAGCAPTLELTPLLVLRDARAVSMGTGRGGVRGSMPHNAEREGDRRTSAGHEDTAAAAAPAATAE